jgi:uncharacterized protein YndB with AHSA1/START domain
MTIQTAETSVRAATEVEAPIERAFRVFTEDIGSWWDPTHHVLRGELAGMVFEPRAGGHIIDRGVDGTECRWARVLAYEPPHRILFSWDVNPRWEVEADPRKSSEVEVRFTELEGGGTRVELEHRHLDRHGDGWEQMRDAVASPGGWPAGMIAFTARVETGAVTFAATDQGEAPCTPS